MKRLRGILSCIVFGSAIALLGAAYAEDQTTSMNPEIAPIILQFVGNDDTFIEPGIWPQFDNTDGLIFSQACLDYAKGISLKSRPAPAGEWTDLLTTNTIPINPDFAKNGKILVTWTVRIVGYPFRYTPTSATGTAQERRTDVLGHADPDWPYMSGELYSMRGNPKLQEIKNRLKRGICDDVAKLKDVFYAGHIFMNFPGGNEYGRVYTRIVDADHPTTPLSREIIMTLPTNLSFNTEYGLAYDPTHTGSALLTPDKFPGGVLPAVIHLKVQWKNTTPFILYSGEGKRSMIVTITRQ